MLVATPWQKRLASSPLGAQDFLHVVTDAITEKRPDWRVTGSVFPLAIDITDELGESQHIFLDSIFRTVSRALPDNRHKSLVDFVTPFTERRTGKPVIDLTRVRPVVKHETFVQKQRADTGKPAPCAWEPLVGDLWVVYALEDALRALHPIEQERQRAAGLVGRDLRAAAVENLQASVMQLEKRPAGTVGCLYLDGRLEAGLLLMNWLWDEIAGEVAGPLLAAVPASDAILYIGGSTPGGADALRSASAGVRASRPAEKILSSMLFRWTTDGWVVHQSV